MRTTPRSRAAVRAAAVAALCLAATASCSDEAEPQPTAATRAAVDGSASRSPSASPSATRTTAPPAPSSTPAATSTAAPSAAPAPSAPPGPAPTGPEDPLAPQPPLETAPDAGGLPACDGSSLDVVEADVLGTAEEAEHVFVIRSTGADCTLAGAPAVTLLAGDRVLVASAPRRGDGSPPVAMSRETSSSFVLHARTGGSCRAADVALVRLPGSSRQLRVATSVEVCDGGVDVGAVGRLADDEVH